MALKNLNASGNPLGQFDVHDTDLASVKGGELVCFKQVNASADLGAYDVDDGYLPDASAVQRTVVRIATAAADRPLMLADDGIAGYGTLFGSVVGGTVGQNVSGTVVGPHTSIGSGKVTCWATPGLYAVTLDNVSAELQPSNQAVDAGDKLTFNTSGLLTIDGGSGEQDTEVGHFVEFATTGSLVNTPNHLVGTFNPPDGELSTANRNFVWAVLFFNPTYAAL